MGLFDTGLTFFMFPSILKLTKTAQARISLRRVVMLSIPLWVIFELIFAYVVFPIPNQPTVTTPCTPGIDFGPMCTIPNPNPNNDANYARNLANHNTFINLSPFLSLTCALIVSLGMISFYRIIIRRRATN